jgi:predicted PurR-regulated permease PerM
MVDHLPARWLWLGGVAAALLLLYLLSPILTPFVIGAGLAYLGDPLVDRLEKLRFSRTGGVCVVFIAIFGVAIVITLILVPMLQDQVVVFLHSLPDWLRWLQDVGLPKLGLSLPEGTRLDAEGIRRAVAEHWAGVGGVAAVAWQKISASGGALLTAAIDAMLVPIVTFYLLRDWDLLVARIDALIPRRTLPTVRLLAHESDEVLAAFIRGQLSVMAALALFYTIGLSIAGLHLALLIGLLAGLVSFVPYLGFIIGIVTASIAMAVQTQELLPLVWIAVVFGIGQLLESMLLTPLLVGHHIGLHPVAVIFAVLAGGELFGFAGVLLALPAAAVIAVLMRHATARWLQSEAYRKEPLAIAPVDASVETPPPGDVPQ